MTESPSQGFLDALVKLAPAPGISYAGVAAVESLPVGTATTAAIMPTSLDPRVATENFTVTDLVAVVGRSGRDITAFSARPQDEEVVLLPGTLLRPALRLEVEDLTVHVLEELSLVADAPAPESWPVGLDQLEQAVRSAVTTARASAPVEVGAPGKFTRGVPV